MPGFIGMEKLFQNLWRGLGDALSILSGYVGSLEESLNAESIAAQFLTQGWSVFSDIYALALAKQQMQL